MNPKPYLWLANVLFAIVLLFSCGKKGDTGPAGPAGPAGPQGPKGDSASSGSVTYSDWLDVAFSPDTIHVGGSIDTIGYYAGIDAPKLTTSIITKGEIKVYVNLGTSASPDVAPLPYFDVFTSVSITPEFLEKKIFLYSNTDAGTATKDGAKHLQYRYIFIPGTTTAGVAPKIQWNVYGAVKNYFGLTD